TLPLSLHVDEVSANCPMRAPPPFFRTGVPSACSPQCAQSSVPSFVRSMSGGFGVTVQPMPGETPPLDESTGPASPPVPPSFGANGGGGGPASAPAPPSPAAPITLMPHPTSPKRPTQIALTTRV